MEYMTAPLKKYADFEGRARRMEYWMFTLFQVVVLVLLMLVGRLLAGGGENPIAGVPYAIGALALLVPSIAVAVRRLHDTNRSGWWIFIGLIPLIGGIWYFILTLLDGTPGPNRFGPDPKGRGGAEASVFE